MKFKGLPNCIRLGHLLSLTLARESEIDPHSSTIFPRPNSLDGFLAVAMDHVSVREGYRLWHGVSHLDDARQAPPNEKHFDGWSMGPNLDSPFTAGQHIPD